MITWPEDLNNGYRFVWSSRTLVYKGKNSHGKWTGVYLTAGHNTELLEFERTNGSALYSLTVNFTPDANNREQDIPVVGIHTFLVQRPNFFDWDDVDILVLEAKKASDPPEPAVLAG